MSSVSCVLKWRKRFANGRVGFLLIGRIYQLGGVDSRRLEKRLESWSRLHQDAQGRPTRKSAPLDQPITGTRLMREYGGEEHIVTTLAQGFEYRGKRYRSLSAIARAITGTSWSGPLFFGLQRANGGGA